MNNEAKEEVKKIMTDIEGIVKNKPPRCPACIVFAVVIALVLFWMVI